MSTLQILAGDMPVLEAMADGEWRTPTEVLELLREQDEQWRNRSSGYVRELLKVLARRHLVERGSQRWGEFRITTAAAGELSRRGKSEVA